MDLIRRLTAEALDTAFLLAIVVESGIIGAQLAAGNEALALLANALATGAGLTVLILIFSSISGAHFNSAVTLAQGQLPWRTVPDYVVAQALGAFVGVASAHQMFALPLFAASQHVRGGVRNSGVHASPRLACWRSSGSARGTGQPPSPSRSPPTSPQPPGFQPRHPLPTLP